MKIQSIRMKNFKVFRDAVIEDIGNMCVIVGANGSGKSTIFDIFSFLQDCMLENVAKAVNKRGGFSEFKSRVTKCPIEIEIIFNPSKSNYNAKYYLSINEDSNRVYVEKELLEYRDEERKENIIIDFSRGVGVASNLDNPNKINKQKLVSDNVLAIKGFSQFEKFHIVSEFAYAIENWYLSDIHVSKIRQSPQIEGVASSLSADGDNIALVADYINKNYPDAFKQIIEKLSQRIPGINSIETKTTEEGRVLLKFKDSSFDEPFFTRYMSDGSIKMFAYLLILYNSEKHNLLCVEEPEKQLYHSLLYELAEEFKLYANEGNQVFISTHSPELLNAMDIDEVYFIKKDKGYSTIEKASDNMEYVDAIENGDIMGYLWKEGVFEGVDPI